MLETEIKNLTAAITLLTATMSNTPPAPVETTTVTSDDLRDLAKQVIKDGKADRKTAKKFITKLGGETITDLDPATLTTLKGQLEAL